MTGSPCSRIRASSLSNAFPAVTTVRVREALDGVRDVERLAGRAALGRATARELGALRDSVLRLPDVRGALDGLEARGRAALLEEAADRFDLLQDLGDELARALVERPPAQASDGDAIRSRRSIRC